MELDEPESEAVVQSKIREAVATYRLAKSETILVLPRGDVEMRLMTFPFVPVEELPEMARFQATREFSGFDPTAPLDFILLNEKGIGSGFSTASVPVLGRRVLAASITSAQKARWTALCDECQLKLRRIAIKPCETAALWRTSSAFDPTRTELIVELDTQEASLAVLHRGQPIYMRSPRLIQGTFPVEGTGRESENGNIGDTSIFLPMGPPVSESSGNRTDTPGAAFNRGTSAWLVAELKRTRFAVRNEVLPVGIDSFILCGVSKSLIEIAGDLRDGVGSPITLFDPWQGVLCSGDLRTSPPEYAEDFASLLGTLTQAVSGRPSDIDLLNPKRKPESLARRRLLTAAGCALLLLCIAILAFGFYRRSALENDIRQLGKEVAELKKEEVSVKKQREQLQAIDTWASDQVNWFEQLDWFSSHLPPSQNVILTSLLLRGTGGGAIELKGLARSAEELPQIEERLWDATHRVRSGEKGEEKGNSQYAFRFDLTVLITPRGEAIPKGDKEGDLNAPETRTASPNNSEAADQDTDKPNKIETPPPEQKKESETPETKEAAPADRADSPASSPATEGACV